MTMQAIDLQTRWEQFSTERQPELRDSLIMQYAPLVKYVIGRMAVSLPGLLNHEDLLSYGTIGLIQAVDRFDPTQGVKFETYAIRRIRGSILDTIRSLQPLSRDASRRAREIEHAYDALILKLQRMPENREVAAYLGLTIAQFQTMLVEATATIFSLDTPVSDIGEGDRAALIDQIADEDNLDPAEHVDQRDLKRDLIRALDTLAERDRLVISLYHFDELTMREIGEVLGVSTSRVSQLYAAALFRLRSLLRSPQTVSTRV
jgi:RNA polymerase sigma factor for flagellar operon FliA